MHSSQHSFHGDHHGHSHEHLPRTITIRHRHKEKVSATFACIATICMFAPVIVFLLYRCSSLSEEIDALHAELVKAHSVASTSSAFEESQQPSINSVADKSATKITKKTTEAKSLPLEITPADSGDNDAITQHYTKKNEVEISEKKNENRPAKTEIDAEVPTKFHANLAGNPDFEPRLILRDITLNPDGTRTVGGKFVADPLADVIEAGYSYLADTNYADAALVFKQVCAEYPHSPYAYFYKALSCGDTGAMQKASDLLFLARKYGGATTESQYYEILTALHLGDKNAAEQYINALSAAKTNDSRVRTGPPLIPNDTPELLIKKLNGIQGAPQIIKFCPPNMTE